MQESFDEWLKRHQTAQDERRKLYAIHTALCESLKAAGHREDYLAGSLIRHNAALPGSGWTTAEKKYNRRKWQPWKDLKRVADCQTQWKGFKPSCCDGRSVAVPIGCNHRLCPLCNAHRAQHYRERVIGLFERIGNPQLLTLTVPNVPKLTKETISTLRKRLRAFLRENKALLEGGVYSIEITRNRVENTWHPHIHILVDVNGMGGQLPFWMFMERKWWLEFSWFVLTQSPSSMRTWTEYEFEEWVTPLDPRRNGMPMTPERVKQLAGRRFGDRRSVDIRPVTTDKKAAYEVMKYMTKVAFFVNDYRAVAEFLQAVKGVRAIQTFGSCYGFKLDDDKPAEAHLTCECGKNKFESIGILGLGMVRLSPEGRWYVRDDAPVHGRHARCRGTPTRQRLQGGDTC